MSKMEIVQKILKTNEAVETANILIYKLKMKGKEGRNPKEKRKGKQWQRRVFLLFSTWLRFKKKLQAFIKCHTANCYKPTYCVGGGYKNELQK